jgi:hypothetical protein
MASSRGRDLRGGQPFIGGAVVARGGDRWARPHACLLARAANRAGSPPQTIGPTNGWLNSRTGGGGALRGYRPGTSADIALILTPVQSGSQQSIGLRDGLLTVTLYPVAL